MVGVETVLPSPGDPVRVAWGLGSVTGRVLESYGGVRPRVVVEVDARELGDEAVSVTVPLGAVEPLEMSTSSWAESARYERAVADALSRCLAEGLGEVRLNAELADAAVDVLATLTDGRLVLVEVKTPTPDRSRLERIVHRFGDVVARQDAYGLVVVPREPTPGVRRETDRVLVVAWRDKQDDARMSAALRQLLSMP